MDSATPVQLVVRLAIKIEGNSMDTETEGTAVFSDLGCRAQAYSIVPMDWSKCLTCLEHIAS